MDRTLVEFFYRLWFRCEVEGIEHVPAEGGALLVSNHSGALPPDASMIAKAIKEEHPRPRPLSLTVEHFFKGYPGFSMLLPKIGAVPAHPANVHRLLFDEGKLVLVFPEGRKGTEKLYTDRYRLRRFGRGGFVEAAMRARAPIVPVAVVGAEEAAPIFAHVGALQKLTGLIYFPITPTFPHFGLLGMLGYLPAKFRIRFLEPGAHRRHGRRAVAGQGARADGARGHPRDDPGGALRHARRATLGLVVDERAGASSSPGSRPTGAVGSRRPSSRIRRSRRSSASTAGRPRSSCSAPSTCTWPTRTRCSGGSWRRPRSTPWSTRGSSSTRSSPAPRRAHENNVIGHDERARGVRRARLAGAQARLQVQRPLLRRRARRPGVLHRGHAPPAPAAHADRARHRRGRGRGARLRPAQPARSPSPCCASPTALGPTCARATRSSSACPPSRRSSASTRATSSSTRTTSPAASSTPSATTSTAGSTTAPPTACSCSQRGRVAAGQAAGARAPAVGHGAGRGRPRPRRDAASRPSAQPRCATAARSTTAAQGDGLPLPLHDAARRSSPSPSTSGSRRSSPARRARATATRRPSRTFLRRSPSVRPTARRPEPRAPANVAPGGRRAPGPPATLDALAAEEVIALLPSLEPGGARRARGARGGESGAGRRPGGDRQVAGLRVDRVTCHDLRCSVT